MASIERKQPSFRLQNNAPKVIRIAAAALLGAALIALIVGFYRARARTPFKLKSEHAQLSTDVVAEVNGYERLESDGMLPKYLIKAAHAKTFADDHQELESVSIQIYDINGEPADNMSSDRMLYVPEKDADKNFTAYFNSNVKVETRDKLKIQSENLTYTKANETAEIEDPLTFERANIRGRSTGAIVKMSERRLELLKDVELETFETPENKLNNIRYAKMTTDRAIADNNADRIDLDGNVVMSIKTANGDYQASSSRAEVFFTSGDKDQRLDRTTLIDNVHIISNSNGSTSTIDAANGTFTKATEKIDLRGGVVITANSNTQPVEMRGQTAVYEAPDLRVELAGHAVVTQGLDVVKGDSIKAKLYPDKKIRTAASSGNAFVHRQTDQSTSDIRANEITAAFTPSGTLDGTVAIGDPEVISTPANPSSYSKFIARAGRSIRSFYTVEGIVSALETDGRTTLTFNAPGNTANAANKEIAADAVRTFFAGNGRDITRAEAIGNAQIVTRAVSPNADSFTTTANAQRFDCEFFAGSSDLKICVGGRPATVKRIPDQPSVTRQNEVLTAENITALFPKGGGDIERFDAAGNAKYNSADRNAIASQIIYTAADDLLRLRGSEPTIWDARGRAKAKEIDWNTASEKAQLRGGVSSTLFGGTSSASPFADKDKPIFITSDQADVDQANEVAVYTGNARAWQGDSYVRSKVLTLRNKEGSMDAVGGVESVLYRAETQKGGKGSTVPVFAASQTLNYQRDSRVLRYREDVDIRQGSDRLTSGSADVILNENNEVKTTVAERSVVITQPGRRATGNWLQYNAGDEVAIIRGDPATVNDARSGASQGSQITVYLREDRYVGEGRTKQNGSGRIRSTYKTTNTP